MFVMYELVVRLLFFFFQAEDGIRDGTVTGVQTCALPIFAASWRCRSSPFIPGMRTSRIRQSVEPSCADVANSSAEANAATRNPTERIKPRRDSRTDSSSSTTETRGTVATQRNCEGGGG